MKLFSGQTIVVMKKPEIRRASVPAVSNVAAAAAFAALGSEQRLELLRALTRAGSKGLATGELGARAGVSGATLTHHLKVLTDAGLITQARHGRFIVCTAMAFNLIGGLADYLTSQCCADR